MMIAKRFVAMSGSLAVVIGLLELPALLNFVDYRKVLPDPNFDRKNPWRAHPSNVPDRELIQVFGAHQLLTGTQSGGDIARVWNLPALGEYDFDYRSDHNGFRNEADLSSAEIIVLGDSIVWAPLVPVERMMTSVLQRLQGRTVANLSQRGYGPQQELAVLRRFGVPLDPQVCVWMFFEGNDIGDMRRYIDITSDWEKHLKSLHSFTKRSFTRSALTLAKELIRPYAGKPIAYRDVAATIRTPTEEARAMYFFYGGIDELLRGPQALEMIRATLEQAGQVCGRHDIRLVFAFVPTKYRVYGHLSETDPRSQMRFWRSGDLPAQLAELVQGLAGDITYLDLTDAFVAHAEKGEMLYWPDDTHWSVEGNRLAAELLNDTVNRAYFDLPLRPRLINAPHHGPDE